MGNEASQSTKLGEKLENDVKVTWHKLSSDCPFPAREGHCASSVGDKLYIFGGVTQAEDDENMESNQLLAFDVCKCSFRKAMVTCTVFTFNSNSKVSGADGIYELWGLDSPGL